MPRIFISYRREDAAGHAGRLHADLIKAFDAKDVFLDLGDIPPGEHFPERIRATLANTDVLIAIIGPRWLSAANARGERRIDEPDDWVRIEIAQALDLGRRVVPVLVGGAAMPSVGQLPQALARLGERQGIELSDQRWDYDMARLIRALGGQAASPWQRKALIAAVLGAAALAIGLTAYRAMNEPRATGGPVSVAPPVKPPAIDVSGRWQGVAQDSAGREFRLRAQFQQLGDRIGGNVWYPTGRAGIVEGRLSGTRMEFVTEHQPQFEDALARISFAGEVRGEEIVLLSSSRDGSGKLTLKREK